MMNPSQPHIEEQVLNSYPNIRTCAILMTDSPVPTDVSKLESYLNAGIFVWFLGEGNSHIVYNISKSQMLHIGRTYGLGRMIWMDNTTSEGIKYELWEKERCSQLSPILQKSTISEEALALHNDIMGRIVEQNAKRLGYDKARVSDRIILLTDDTVNGKCQYLSRGNLYGGYKRLLNIS